VTARRIVLTGGKQEGVMALAIVWRNPLPPSRTETKLERLVDGQSGASYLVIRPDFAQHFELVLGGAA
jgi:hypothetical protein